MNDPFVVNIGRQLGSGGYEIGKKLANRLNIGFYDKELIELASNESGLCREFFERADEQSSVGILGNLFSLRFPYVGEGSIPGGNCLSNDALFKIQSDVIRRLADEKSCLFVGRCADYILREKAQCVNLFISAPKEYRIDRVSNAQLLLPDEAAELIEKTDKKRASYYNYYTTKEWGVASSYHLCIDSTQLGIDGTVDFLEHFIVQRRKTADR